MIVRANFHTHTTWCDGSDSPEAVIQAAIARNFDAIGFSSHAMLPENVLDWVLTPEKDLLYKAFSYHTGETEGSSYTLFSPFARHKDFPEWLDALVKGSAFDSSLPGRYYERVLTLSTCTSRSYTERMILQGVLIKELPES